MPDMNFEDHITFIYTQDIEKMKEFYGEILGLPMMLEQSNCFVFRVNDKSYIGVCGVNWTSPQSKVMEERNMMITLVTDQLEEWDKRLEWVDGAQLVEMNPEKCSKWEAKYAAKNQERLENFRAGKDEFKILTADQGE